MSDEQHPASDRVEISSPAFELDGIRHMTVYSHALRGRADVSIFVPPGIEGCITVPIVILLHGVYGSHWAWFHQGGAHKTARLLMERRQIRPMLLVAPSDGLDGDGTGYLPSDGRNYESWICNDLLVCLKEQFCAAGQREEIFIAGLSMGGYGALRLGAKYPAKFKGISAHSAITRTEDFHSFIHDVGFLKNFPAEEIDPFHWFLCNKEELPPIRFDCGEQDSLLPANKVFHERLEQHRIPHVFVVNRGGHNWPYWQLHVIDTLLFVESILSREITR